MARKLIVEIIGDSKSLEKSFARSSAASKKFGHDMERSVRGVAVGTGAFHSLGRSVAFASGAFLGGAGLGAAVKGAFSELNDGRKVAAQTNAVLRSTGGAAGVTAAQVDALGNSLLRKTGIDDEQIKSTENMLLTFRNIRNEVGQNNDIFNQATAATLDMSVAMGTDSTESAILLGKALNDPVKGITALTRVGVTFTDAQKKQIQTLVETGRTMEAQKVILHELTAEFGGSAKAAGDVQPWNLLRETIKNFSAELATDALPTIQKTTAALQKFFDNPQNTQRIKNDLGNVIDTIRGIFELDFNHPPRWMDEMDASMMEKINGWKRAINDFANLPGGVFRNVPAAPLPGLQTPSLTGKLTTDVFNGLGVDPLAGLGAALSAGRRAGARATARTNKNIAKTPFRSFQLALAEATRSRRDDENVLQGIIRVLRQRVGRTTNLAAKTDLQDAINQYQDQLHGLLADDAQDVRDAADKVKEKRKAARDAARSALDDLTSALGEQVANLREQAARIKQEDIARRSRFETPLRLQLAAARASATPGDEDNRAAAAKVAAAARKALKSGNLLMQGQIDAWNTLADALSGLNKESGTATAFHKQSVSELAANLGLSRDKRLELEGRLARRSRLGTVPNQGTGAFGRPIIIENRTTVELDGQKVGTSVTKRQQVQKRRNPPQKRGPHGI